MVTLVYNVSGSDDPRKVRYANYASVEDAVRQAEHELATDAAVARHWDRFAQVLHPSGVAIVGVQDEQGEWLWRPDA